MAKKPLPLGTWGEIWILAVHHDDNGRPDKFEARANYRDFDGRTRLVSARDRTKTGAANKLRLVLKGRRTVHGSGALQATDRVATAIEMFLANQQALVDEGMRSPGTLATYRQQVGKHLLPRIGEVRIWEASTPLVNEVIGAISSAVGAATAKTCKSILAGSLAMAVTHGALTLNPVREIKIVSRHRRSAPRSLNEEERGQWFELLRQDDRAVRADLIDLCKFMLATGERIGEALAVRWNDLNPERGEVNCSHQIQRVKGEGLVRLPVKTEAGDRVLVLPAWALSMLDDRRQPGTADSSPIFPDSKGGYRDPHNVRKALRDVRQPVGSERRRELGRMLRDHRRAAGLTQVQAVARVGWKKTRISLVETGRIRLEPDDAAILAELYKVSKRDRAVLLELAELAGIRSVADELAWVTSHKFRKTTATILDDAGHSPRQMADQLGHSRTTTTMDDYIGRKARNPAAAKDLDDALRAIHEQDRQVPEGGGI